MKAQIFTPNANALAKVTIAAVLLLITGVIAAMVGIYLSPWFTDVGVAKAQPVPFSHKHHVDQLKIECRYCHATVEKAAYAGYPATETCMSCHSQVWTNSPLLEPVRESYQTGEPLLWNKIYDVPDFVYFNHSAHVNNGIGCSSCHGRIDQQHLAAKAQPLYMGWCLGCHRNVEDNIRPADQVFNMDWQPAANQAEIGRQLIAEYGIQTSQLTNCYICHR
jgi:hypothetical protein